MKDSFKFHGKKDKTFLIIGAGGLIGQNVVHEISDRYTWYGTYSRRPRHNLLKCDVTNLRNLKEIFDEVRPTHVVHCGSLAGGVDACEKNRTAAKNFYTDGAFHLGQLCRRYHARLIFISTECVFDGKKEVYVEDDLCNPVNYYGECKAEAEKLIRNNLKNYVIVRTMSVFGWQPETETPNAVMKVYFSIQKKEKVPVPVYRWGTPTYVRDLAKALAELSLAEESGIYHVAGASYTSRYDWLKKTCEALGWNDYFLVPQTEGSQPIAYRPAKVRLSTNKFCSAHQTKLRDLDEALVALKQDVLSNNNR